MILPAPSTGTETYWRAARDGKLLLRHCRPCGRWFHPRHELCHCGRPLSWKPSGGTGILLAFTVIRYVFNPAYQDQVPYTITLTRLGEGPQILSSLPGAQNDLTCGMAMEVTFDQVTPEVTLPRFAPV